MTTQTTNDPKSTAARLRYTRLPYNAQECDDCGAVFTVRPGGFAVGGDVLRGHRRRCPVAPENVPIPGSCDS